MRQDRGVLPEGCHGVPKGMLREVYKGMHAEMPEAVRGGDERLLRQGGNGEALLQAIVNELG